MKMNSSQKSAIPANAPRKKRKEYYISPMGTVEEVSPEALAGDRDYIKDFPFWWAEQLQQPNE
jgi:hypothetical protein